MLQASTDRTGAVAFAQQRVEAAAEAAVVEPFASEPHVLPRRSGDAVFSTHALSLAATLQPDTLPSAEEPAGQQILDSQSLGKHRPVLLPEYEVTTEFRQVRSWPSP